MKSMKTRYAETSADLTVGEVGRAAHKMFHNRYQGPMLVSWYDRKNRRAGPMEACDGQPFKVARDYALSNGAETCIVVDKGDYNLFFRSTPRDAAELDREICLQIHQELELDRYENVMGG